LIREFESRNDNGIIDLMAPVTFRSWYDMGAEMDHEFKDVGTRMLRKMPIAVATPRLK